MLMCWIFIPLLHIAYAAREESVLGRDQAYTSRIASSYCAYKNIHPQTCIFFKTTINNQLNHGQFNLAAFTMISRKKLFHAKVNGDFFVGMLVKLEGKINARDNDIQAYS